MDGQAWVACDNSNYDLGLSAGHVNITGGEPTPNCLRRLCWETSAGVEFYRLTVLDLLTQVTNHSTVSHWPDQSQPSIVRSSSSSPWTSPG